MRLARRKALLRGLAVAGAAGSMRVPAQERRADVGRATATSPPRFSTMPSGAWLAPGESTETIQRGSDALPSLAAWRHRALRGIAPNRFGIVDDGFATHVRVEVNGSASALIARLPAGVQGESVRWRWRADGFPARAGLGMRETDDFAARLYLMFELPDARLSWSDRLVLGSASLLQGEPVPAATLVYLLHAGDAPSVPIASPFSDRVAMFVARGNALPGRWYAETRNWRQDFERAFGARYPGPVPAPAAVAIGADGDQTGARFTSALGDVIFE